MVRCSLCKEYYKNKEQQKLSNKHIYRNIKNQFKKLVSTDLTAVHRLAADQSPQNCNIELKEP